MTRMLVVPAAGRGVRLGWDGPKVLAPVGGRPMIDHLLARYAPVVDRIVVVVAPAAVAAVRRHLEERLARIERYAKVSEARVVLDEQKGRHVTEIVVHVKGKELVAREDSHDARGSIEAAVERLERQVKRAKEKRTAQALRDGTHPNGDEKEGADRTERCASPTRAILEEAVASHAGAGV